MLILPPLTLRPDLLTSPVLPKPLHGLNPRTIDPAWWEQEKRRAKLWTWDRCEVCGVMGGRGEGKWLECHEEYRIDWNRGVAEYVDCHPLCHYCHNFIHSARLQVILNKEKSQEEIKKILEHGFKILSDNHLPAFPFTLLFAEQIQAETYGVLPYDFEPELPEWSEWRLIFRGEAYEPKFATEQEWRSYYQKLSQERENAKNHLINS